MKLVPLNPEAYMNYNEGKILSLGNNYSKMLFTDVDVVLYFSIDLYLYPKFVNSLDVLSGERYTELITW